MSDEKKQEISFRLNGGGGGGTFFIYSSLQNTIDFLADWILQKVSVYYGRNPSN